MPECIPPFLYSMLLLLALLLAFQPLFQVLQLLLDLLLGFLDLVLAGCAVMVVEGVVSLSSSLLLGQPTTNTLPQIVERRVLLLGGRGGLVGGWCW